MLKAKILVIGTETPHRKYLINKLIEYGHNVTHCIFDDKLIIPPFNTTPSYSNKEESILNDLFDLKNFSGLNKVKVYNVKNINSKRSNNLIKKISPDITIISGAPKLKINTINTIKKLCVNVHLGFVSKYRGLDSNLWAIYHRDYNNIGITLHKIENKLDSGEIYLQSKLKISSEVSVYSLRYFETKKAIKMLNIILHNYYLKKLKSKKQKTLGRYYSFMPTDLKNIVEKRLNKKIRKFDYEI